jgi:hypothetical protein
MPDRKKIDGALRIARTVENEQAFEDDDTKSISEVARLLDITARRSACQTSVLHVVAK